MAQERSVIKFIRPCLSIHEGGSLDIENYCTVSLFFEQTYL